VKQALPVSAHHGSSNAHWAGRRIATTFKDADLRHARVATALTSRKLIRRADTNNVSANSNTLSRRTEDRPARCYPATDATNTSRLAVARPPTQRRPAGSQSPGRRPRKTDESACCDRSGAGILQARPTLEKRPFSWPTTPHWLPHTLPSCPSVYSSNSSKYLL
jgi:hypothetical protein